MCPLIIDCKGFVLRNAFDEDTVANASNVKCSIIANNIPKLTIFMVWTSHLPLLDAKGIVVITVNLGYRKLSYRKLQRYPCEGHCCHLKDSTPLMGAAFCQLKWFTASRWAITAGPLYICRRRGKAVESATFFFDPPPPLPDKHSALCLLLDLISSLYGSQFESASARCRVRKAIRQPDLGRSGSRRRRLSGTCLFQVLGHPNQDEYYCVDLTNSSSLWVLGHLLIWCCS